MISDNPYVVGLVPINVAACLRVRSIPRSLKRLFRLRLLLKSEQHPVPLSGLVPGQLNLQFDPGVNRDAIQLSRLELRTRYGFNR